MALSEKVALLGCLGFIFGMCWLVTLVARPMVDLPTPLVARGPGARPGGGTVFVADFDSRRAEGGGSALVANRFARPSPVEVSANPGQWNGDALMVAETLPPGSGWEDDALPPLHVPEAPVVAMADETTPDPAELPEAGGPLSPETPMLEAVVAAAPAPEAGLLAAPAVDARPGQAAAEETAEVAATNEAWGPSAVKTYKVKRGDTLVKIMRREWGHDDPGLMSMLVAANPKLAERRDRIYVGEELRIPALEPASRTLAAVGHEGRAGPGIVLAAAHSSLTAQPAVDARRHVGAGNAPDRPDVRWYTIRKRDCLTSIARRILNDEARWREIAKLNRLRDVDRILPGTRIKLPPVNNDT